MTQFGAITKHQIKRLQTVYGQLQAHAQLDSGRAARIQWASESVGRQVASFSALTFAEAKSLIDSVQGQLGVKAPPVKRKSQEQAHRAGLDGRKDGAEFAAAPQIASAEDLAVIERFYLRLGWDRTRFDAWLVSPHSPLGRRSTPTIRTSADANQVRWALIGMLKSQGLWLKKGAA